MTPRGRGRGEAWLKGAGASSSAVVRGCGGWEQKEESGGIKLKERRTHWDRGVGQQGWEGDREGQRQQETERERKERKKERDRDSQSETTKGSGREGGREAKSVMQI